MGKTIILDIPKGMYIKIGEVLYIEPLFMDHNDVIIHAITDLLEKYRRKGI